MLFCLAVLLIALGGATPAWAGDSPAGFWWGSDSSGPNPSGSASPCPTSSAPWDEPNVSNSGCGRYGGYVGEVGGYWTTLSCSGFVSHWDSSGASDAVANLNAGSGKGLGAYWFAGGPGMDPSYNGTTSEAYAWGKRQADGAENAAGNTNSNITVIWMDVEDGGGNAGWNEQMTPGSCSHVQSTSACCSASVDRATINGFIDEIWNKGILFPGVYSSVSQWSSILGTGTSSNMTNIMEWTSIFGGNCTQPGPTSWSQGSGSCSSHSASFFGGVTTSGNCAVEWQWAGNSSGDYDQIDGNRYLLCE
ncbi:MAG TPA: hypothetical protein VF834_00635 [Streptosporangiaceae bacterium]